MASVAGRDKAQGPHFPARETPPEPGCGTALTPARHTGVPALHAASLPAELEWVAAHETGEVLAKLAASEAGLTEREAAIRLGACGPNTIAANDAPHWLASLARRLASPVNAMLMVLSAISILVHDNSAAVLIGGMIVLSVSLATWQETRSDRAVAALRSMVHTTIAVRRRAATGSTPAAQERPITELVPGDIIHLAAGDLIPADVRLLTSKDLFVNQAALTGESMPVEKFPERCTAAAQAGDLGNIALMGTAVVSGTAMAVVVLTGERAIFGHIAKSIASHAQPTDFETGLSRIARLMLALIAVLAPLVFLINWLTKGDWFEAVLFAMAVGVGLAPEMLPMLVTVNLAKGALAMSRRKVIIKRLAAIQNLGAMDTLCTDKTGTLTQDLVILKQHVDLAGHDSERVLEFAYLNSYFQSSLHNLLDVAVLQHETLSERLGIAQAYKLIDEIPYDFTRRRMSVVVQAPHARLLICKGAVEEVFSVSTAAELDGRRVPLDAEHYRDLTAISDHLNDDGFRVIAIAFRELPEAPATHPYGLADEKGLTPLGYIAFLDPPKESAAPALSALANSGIEVKILTGDSPRIASKICQMVGLAHSTPVLGSDLDKLDGQGVAEATLRNQVFAKLTPAHKATIVSALRGQGRVVGVLGDGINDGPALRAADVGISVDSAADIARESADVILLEKNLLVLHDGVMEGRRVFANLLKYLRMSASSNFGNIFSVLGASAWLPFLPMAPLQLLTNNLLYDFSQTALPTDNVDDESLRQPRRWEIGKMGGYILAMGPVSSIFDYLTFAALFWLFGANTPALTTLFQTGWFIESLFSQTLIVHVIRTRRLPFLESRPSQALLATSLALCLVGAWLPYSPLAQSLGMQPLPASFWPLLAVILLGYAFAAFAARRLLARWIPVD
ncbi:Mg2+-importing ATPase [Cupriavidus sp. YR651]|uniref:magnesium-translocating P-type ATPase n=1 Tax=Cupriavidus sp. YR651 TaxID=1855315 RepID=UPI000885B7DA|nr:magnesium-translocating P-type ATPase [Cupriavidus sp. YR651]SDD85020.1 Mg2+-importing ATPase [Cupriavidus sp. YR651]